MTYCHSGSFTFPRSCVSKSTCGFQLHSNTDFKAFNEKVYHVYIYKVSKVKKELLPEVTILRVGCPFLSKVIQMSCQISFKDFKSWFLERHSLPGSQEELHILFTGFDAIGF